MNKLMIENIIALILFIVGSALLIKYAGWLIFLGIFFLIWSNNIGRTNYYNRELNNKQPK